LSFAYQNLFVYSATKHTNPNRHGCNTQHTTRLRGPGIHSERDEQQSVQEYRIDYDAPRVAHRSCSALRRLPARARPDLLASSLGVASLGAQACLTDSSDRAGVATWRYWLPLGPQLR